MYDKLEIIGEEYIPIGIDSDGVILYEKVINVLFQPVKSAEFITLKGIVNL